VLGLKGVLYGCRQIGVHGGQVHGVVQAGANAATISSAS
jgi:hypothetical protein